MPDLSPLLSSQHTTALHLAATWMSERYFRTFRTTHGAEGADGAEDGATGAGAFDTLLQQRERRVGVTIESL